MFHRGESPTETVWEKLMLGLSTRKYGHAVRELAEAYDLERSAISEHFIEASRSKLKELMERCLEKKFCALLIDATPFTGQWIVAALGIEQDRCKTILGLRLGPRRMPSWWASCWETWSIADWVSVGPDCTCSMVARHSAQR
jgi:transposase-like protein